MNSTVARRWMRTKCSRRLTRLGKVHPLGTNGELQVYVAEDVILHDGKLALRAERTLRDGDGIHLWDGLVAR